MKHLTALSNTELMKEYDSSLNYYNPHSKGYAGPYRIAAISDEVMRRLDIATSTKKTK